MIIPVVIHFNNESWRRRPDIKRLITKLLSNLKKSDDHSYKNELDILVCNNQRSQYMTEISLDIVGCEYHKLGTRIKWHSWHSNGLKLKLCYEYLKESKKEYAMHLDGRDVIILDTPSKILDRFKIFDCDMLFNAEAVYYQKVYDFDNGKTLHNTIREKEEKLYKEDAYKFKSRSYNNGLYYLNSGCWIGKRSFVLKILKECVDYYNKYRYSCDQALMHKKFYEYYPQIQIDNKGDIFQCMYKANESDLRSV